MNEEAAPVEQQAFGWRELLGVVNLRDFAQMVGGEIVQIGASFRLALESFAHLPLGPLIGVAGLLILLLRTLLLALVIVVFGSAILAITFVRSVARIVQTREDSA